MSTVTLWFKHRKPFDSLFTYLLQYTQRLWSTTLSFAVWTLATRLQNLSPSTTGSDRFDPHASRYECLPLEATVRAIPRNSRCATLYGEASTVTVMMYYSAGYTSTAATFDRPYLYCWPWHQICMTSRCSSPFHPGASACEWSSHMSTRHSPKESKQIVTAEIPVHVHETRG